MSPKKFEKSIVVRQGFDRQIMNQFVCYIARLAAKRDYEELKSLTGIKKSGGRGLLKTDLKNKADNFERKQIAPINPQNSAYLRSIIAKNSVK